MQGLYAKESLCRLKEENDKLSTHNDPEPFLPLEVFMHVPTLRHLTLTQQLRLGFGLLLFGLLVTFGANLFANTQHQAITDRLIQHIYPARHQADVIVTLTLSIDDDGAWYVLSHDPPQQVLLLQRSGQNVQALRQALAQALTLADTPAQRAAISDLQLFFFGPGGYDATTQQIFAQKKANQDLTAGDSYVRSPFLSVIEQDTTIYTTVVEQEITQEQTQEQALANLVRFLNLGVGGGVCFLALGIALFLTRSIGRLYHQIATQNAELAESNTRLQALATTDLLTELPNHRALLQMIPQELQRAQRYEHPCSLLFLDLDHFKALNDGYGHAAGDTALREFGGVLTTTIRHKDTAGRWGGEEFVILLPETSLEEAVELAEQVRKAVSFHPFGISGGLHLTCSIGVASSPDHATDLDTLITHADQAMYAAKHLGRNQVRTADDPAVLALLAAETAEGGREESALRGTVEALVTLVEERDHSLAQHSQEVATLVGQLARAFGMPREQAEGVALAGHLHDIGKIAIPDAILLKPGPLTDEEWTLMRRHAIVGAEVVSHIPSVRPLVPVIQAHHEWYNGGGYPNHLQGEQIPFAARLISVVDAYSVMITDRPYQQACSPAAALQELRRCAGTQFDPQVVEALITLLQERQDPSQQEVA
jgi:diguanylate cyclase (GGDEF)-like protein/putative nucleotidyltransferase with HDIG domain